MNSPQVPVLQLSSPPSVDTKLLFVMFLALQSYLLTLLVAMLPNVATQLAKFAALPVVLRASVQSILSGTAKLPFTSRAARLALQAACPNPRRTHAHLTQGTPPSKKLTNLKDVKRYLNVAQSLPMAYSSH